MADAVTALTYERSLDPFSSIEITHKVNGFGVNNDNDKSGFGLAVGYKIKTGSIFKDRSKYRPNHVLHGGYFRFNAGYNSVDFDQSAFDENYHYFNLGILRWLCLGVNNVLL